MACAQTCCINFYLYPRYLTSRLYKSVLSPTNTFMPYNRRSKDTTVQLSTAEDPIILKCYHPTMKLSTILSAPLLSAAVLAGPVAEVPANTTDPNPDGLPNLVALFFTVLGAPACAVSHPHPISMTEDD